MGRFKLDSEKLVKKLKRKGAKPEAEVFIPKGFRKNLKNKLAFKISKEKK